MVKVRHLELIVESSSLNLVDIELFKTALIKRYIYHGENLDSIKIDFVLEIKEVRPNSGIGRDSEEKLTVKVDYD